MLKIIYLYYFIEMTKINKKIINYKLKKLRELVMKKNYYEQTLCQDTPLHHIDVLKEQSTINIINPIHILENKYNCFLFEEKSITDLLQDLNLKYNKPLL